MTGAETTARWLLNVKFAEGTLSDLIIIIII